MPPEDGPTTLALLEEQLTVGKIRTVTDRLRVSTTVETRPILLEDVLAGESLTVERIAVEREVAEVPEPRQEGDTLIVSVVEERPVVEKRLFVIEEVRITRVSTSQHVAIPETVRTMRATVDRIEPTSTGRETDG